MAELYQRSADIDIQNQGVCSFTTKAKLDLSMDNIAELIIESGTFENEVDLQLGFKIGKFRKGYIMSLTGSYHRYQKFHFTLLYFTN